MDPKEHQIINPAQFQRFTVADLPSNPNQNSLKAEFGPFSHLIKRSSPADDGGQAGDGGSQ